MKSGGNAKVSRLKLIAPSTIDGFEIIQTRKFVSH